MLDNNKLTTVVLEVSLSPSYPSKLLFEPETKTILLLLIIIAGIGIIVPNDGMIMIVLYDTNFCSH